MRSFGRFDSVLYGEEYDAARGWLTGKRYHGQTQPSLQYTYSPGGRLLTRTNGRGIVTTYNYRLGAGEPGNGGLLALIDYSDGTPDVQYTYDRRGRMIHVLDAAGYRTIAYTNDGQPTAEDIAWNNNSANLLEGLGTNSSYGQTAGLSNYRQRTQMELKNNNFVFHRMKYEYNADRRLSRVRRVLGWSQSDYFDVLYGYDTLTGQVNQTTYRRRTSPDDNSTGNNIITGTRTFDRLGRLSTQVWTRNSSTPATLADEQLGYDALGRRTAKTSSTFKEAWSYGYDTINQLTSASAVFPGTTQEIPGAQFGYEFDQIGNRTKIRTPKQFTYTANALNQYSSRQVPDTVHVSGRSSAPVVLVWSPGGTPNQPTEAWRYMAADGFFHSEVEFDNANVARREYVSIQEAPGPYSSFQVFIPRSPEAMTYDADGNLLSDSMWDYTWDAENRLTAMQLKSAANLPIMQIVFAYDHMGRRIRKMLQTTLQAAQYYDNGATQLAWSTSYDHRYLYQGPAEWLLGATMVVDEYSNLYDQQLFAWGVDLSGSEQGAGGIGGLIMFQDTDGGGPMMPLYDTNGNLTHLFSRDGFERAEYQYGPFGEVRGQTHPAAAQNPFRFSTKFTDNETGLLYYGYRYYSASIGRWISRDPIEEGDGPNVMAFVGNGPVDRNDVLGRWTYRPGGTWAASLTTMSKANKIWFGTRGSDISASFSLGATDSGSECATCMRISVIQIFRASYAAHATIPGLWHVDANPGPYYPNTTPLGKMGVAMNDSPQSITPNSYVFFGKPWFMAETCAVCSAGVAPALNTVYSCMTWEFEFDSISEGIGLPSLIVKRRINKTWNVGGGHPMGLLTPPWAYEGDPRGLQNVNVNRQPPSPPSANMKRLILNKYPIFGPESP